MVLRLAQAMHKLMKQLEWRMQQPMCSGRANWWRGFGSFLRYSKAGKPQALDTHPKIMNQNRRFRLLQLFPAPSTKF